MTYVLPNVDTYYGDMGCKSARLAAGKKNNKGTRHDEDRREESARTEQRESSQSRPEPSPPAALNAHGGRIHLLLERIDRAKVALERGMTWAISASVEASEASKCTPLIGKSYMLDLESTCVTAAGSAIEETLAVCSLGVAISDAVASFASVDDARTGWCIGSNDVHRPSISRRETR